MFKSFVINVADDDYLGGTKSYIYLLCIVIHLDKI